MPAPARILIVDDDPMVADAIAEVVRSEGYDCAVAHDGKAALALLDGMPTGGKPTEPQDDRPFGVLVTDLNMPGMSGLALLAEVNKRHPQTVPIVVTGFAKIESAVNAIKLGAIEYLTKPVVDQELMLAVNKAAQQHALIAENQDLKARLDHRDGLADLVGNDHRMQKVYDLVEAVAPSRTTVLITGASGTGKTMVARAIHGLSPRADKPFVTFSCGAIPESLLESELFGHVKGAFTGADYDKPGKVLAADGGTLLIDEINSATPALQLKLLRVLQERKFEKVGSAETVEVDVRFVLATNRDLPDLVENGAFREDLYYRINVVNIAMPALADRPGDVQPLAEHFLERYCKEMGKRRRLAEPAVDALRRYAWPGNVRELENAIERAVVLSQDTVITPDDLPEAVTGPRRVNGVNGHAAAAVNGSLHVAALDEGWTPTPLSDVMADCERQVLLAALEANGWNRQQTADQLEINRATLYKKVRLHRLDEPG